GDRLLGRAVVRTAAARHAEAHPRLRRRRQGHRQGSARRPRRRLAESVQGRRKDEVVFSDASAMLSPRPETQGAAVARPVPRPATLVTPPAPAPPAALAGKVRGLSDRAIAWLFIGPTMLLLLAINIFPLIWTIRLSFTNFRANRPNATVLGVGIDNYVSVPADGDIWLAMQATAHFLFWTIFLQTLIGFALAYLIDRRFRGHGFWTTVILSPMMLSPAGVGNFWAFLYQPQMGLFNYAVSLLTGIPASSFSMIGEVKLAPWAIIIVDT